MYAFHWQEQTVVPAWNAKRRCMTTSTTQTGITAQISSNRVPTGIAVRFIVLGNIPRVSIDFVWQYKPTAIIIFNNTSHFLASENSSHEEFYLLGYNAV
jgi:hypothetical protein